MNMTERCGACGTVGVTNSTGRFVSRDCLRSSELSAELSTTRAQVAELEAKLAQQESAEPVTVVRSSSYKVTGLNLTGSEG